MNKIDTSDFTDNIWYYDPPKWYSMWRGGSYWCYHFIGRGEKIADHVTSALEFVDNALKEANPPVQFNQDTCERKYGSGTLNYMQVRFRKKSGAVQFKLAYCDQ
jgi:hypothetical protein